MTKGKVSAVAGLVTGALVWGLIWYPFRVLEQAGIAGAPATLATYAVALAASGMLFRRELSALLKPDRSLLLIAATAGWCNLAYVLGMLHGQVMQVLLLFYLAPLWTLLFARILLNERPGAVGVLVLVLSLGGAALMLWEPGVALPIPRSAAEWLGLSSGLTFALSNVLSRQAQHHTVRVKSTAVFVGVVVMALLVVAFDLRTPSQWTAPSLSAIAPVVTLVVTLGVVLLATNVAVQHGLALVSANQAIVIMLSELLVAAMSAYLLAGEAMRWNEWAGGSMIVAASLLSGRLERR